MLMRMRVPSVVEQRTSAGKSIWGLSISCSLLTARSRLFSSLFVMIGRGLCGVLIGVGLKA